MDQPIRDILLSCFPNYSLIGHSLPSQCTFLQGCQQSLTMVQQCTPLSLSVRVTSFPFCWKGIMEMMINNDRNNLPTPALSASGCTSGRLVKQLDNIRKICLSTSSSVKRSTLLTSQTRSCCLENNVKNRHNTDDRRNDHRNLFITGIRSKHDIRRYWYNHNPVIIFILHDQI